MVLQYNLVYTMVYGRFDNSKLVEKTRNFFYLYITTVMCLQADKNEFQNRHSIGIEYDELAKGIKYINIINTTKKQGL